jgi:hypothetical protein
MAKAPPPGRCVHCLGDFEELTWDHVFPRAWYPDTTPDNLEKWSIPACPTCNNRLSRLEQDLLLKFALCMEPTEHTTELIDGVLRSIDPNAGRNRQDSEHRRRKRQRLKASLTESDEPPDKGLFPGFEPAPDYPPGESYLSVPIAVRELQQLSEKLARGLAFKLQKLFLEPKRYEISFTPQTDEVAAQVLPLFEPHATRYSWGPALHVLRAAAADDPHGSICSIEYWERFRVIVTVLPIAR